MTSHTFGAFIDIDQGSAIKDPPAVHQPAAVVNSPSVVELDEFTWGSQYNGPQAQKASQSIPQTPKTPKTPGELESSRPPSPIHEEAHLVQSWSSPPMNKWRVLDACIEQFGNGLNDAAPGALIPYMEQDYRIGYAVVSLIFVTNAVGFISAAFITDFLTSKFGRAKSLMFAEALVLAGYVIVVCTPPFPVVVVAFLLLGLGMAITLALNNVFLANMTNSTMMLGLGHGSYGIGGTIGPIIATSMVSHGIIWSRFYLIGIGIRAVAFVFSGWVYRNYEKEAGVQLMSALERTASRRATREAGSLGKRQLLMKALKDKTTLFGALFIFAYQGAEVSISGWVISFLINYRGGDPARVGYVTAGFWAGITVGRFTLSHIAHRLGEKAFVYGLIAGSMAFQLLVWLVPNVIGDAVAVAILGLLLGPVYPCSASVFTRLLPRNLQMTAISFISSAGSSGGAIAPFTTGLLAQAVGTFVLHPVCIGLFVVMELCWFVLPKLRKRSE